MKITIIIPMWNVEEYIIDTLSSICKQTFKEYEVICIDDGSVDNTVSLVEDFIVSNKNVDIKLIKILHSGVSAARNIALDIVSGEYIFFLDADDKIFSTTTLYDLYVCAKKNDADVVFSSFVTTDGSVSNKIFDIYTNDVRGITILESCDFGALQGNPSQYFCKTSLIKNNNIRFLENYYMEDLLFLTELLISATVCNVTRYKSIIKRIRKEAITNSNGLYNKDILKIIEEHIILFERNNMNFVLEKYKNSILKQVLFFYDGIKNNELKNMFKEDALNLYKTRMPEMLHLIQNEFVLYEKRKCLCCI